MYTQEINHALKVHEYVDKLEKVTNLPLKNSPIILGTPSKKIIFEIPESSRVSSEYVEPLYEGIGDHDLLFKAMRTGWPYINLCTNKIPKSQEKFCKQWSHSHALSVAKERGYLVEDKLAKGQQIAYGEYEAYYAVRELLYGNGPGIWLKKHNFDNFIRNYANWYTNVKLVTSQFIVPNSEQISIGPYIFDQLWVFSPQKESSETAGFRN